MHRTESIHALRRDAARSRDLRCNPCLSSFGHGPERPVTIRAAIDRNMPTADIPVQNSRQVVSFDVSIERNSRSRHTLRAFQSILSERQLTASKGDTQGDSLVVGSSISKLPLSIRAGYDRSGSVTGHRPGKLAERQLFDLMAGRNQLPIQPVKQSEVYRLVSE